MGRAAVFLFFLISFSDGAGQQVRWAGAVDINGVSQWVTARGSDAKNPVLLFLHGGPGNSVISYARKFTSELERKYIVVQWDQRNSGKTATLSSVTPPVSVEILKSDVAAMIQHLRKQFSCEGIYLAGHSWGGFLALIAAQEHPEWLYACFAINPMVKQDESERQSLVWMKEEARRQGKKDALIELDNVKVPFVDFEDLYVHRKWLSVLQGRKPVSREFVEQWSRQWLTLFKEASAMDLTTATVFRCPVYFFLGSSDRQTVAQITADYYGKVQAEKKDLFWFTKSSHSLNLTEPKKLQDIILSLRNP
ncbi:MAG: alpha/beta hydrolase [Cyclobacteriaceae bacterium]|nr:alpha/beta hydrolase [Cyclobacteriaceae bacterium]